MTVRDSVSGRTMIITKRSATDLPVVVADTEPVADFPTFCDNGFTSLPSDPSINELGEVAFQGNLSRLTTRPECDRRAARTAAGCVPRKRRAAHHDCSHHQPAGGRLHLRVPRRRPVGQLARQVAIVPELDVTFDQGLFVGSRNGTFNRRFLADTPTADGFNFNNLSSRVSLNELGQIAFESGLNDSSVGGIFLSNPNGTFRTIVDNTGGLSSVTDPR